MTLKKHTSVSPNESLDWKTKFSRDGYAIIKSAIPSARAAYYRQMQFAWLERFNLGFNRNDKTTWRKECVPPNIKDGIYSGHCLAHEKFMWEARLEPGIIQPFAELWDTSELLVSFDGMNVTPPQTTQSEIHITPWPHTDQHPEDLGFLCAQGLLNTGPCGLNDGGLILVKGSAALWNDFWEDKAGKSKLMKQGKNEIGNRSSGRKEVSEEKDLTLFTSEEVVWFQRRGCEVHKLLLDPGDLVIWDSRTIHYNCAPQGDHIRSAMYICYAPAELATAKDIEKKISLFYGFQGTNHWPHINIRGTGKDFNERKRPIETHEWEERMLQLAGVEPYLT